MERERPPSDPADHDEAPSRFALLSAVALHLGTDDPTTATYDRIRELICAGMGADRCTLFAMSQRSGEARFLGTGEWETEAGLEALAQASLDSAAKVDDSRQFRLRALADEGARRMFERGMERGAYAVLRSGGVVVGLLAVGRRAPDRFSEAEMTFLRDAAALIGHALGSRLRTLRARAEATEQQVLAEVAAVAARETDAGRLVNGLWPPLGRLFPRPWVAFGYFRGETVEFPVVDRPPIRLKADWITERVREDGIFIGRTDEMVPEEAAIVRSFGVERWVAFLSTSGGDEVGMLTIASRDPAVHFTRDQLAVFRVIAQIVGPAFANIGAAERTRREAAEQRVLAEIASAAASAPTPVALLRAIREPMKRVVPRPWIEFGFLEGERVVYNFPEDDPIVTPTNEGVEAALREGQVSIRKEDGELPPDALLPGVDILLSHGVGDRVLTAAVTGGTPIGILVVGTREPGYHFTAGDMALLRVIAGIVGPAMANTRAAAAAVRDAHEQRALAAVAAAAAAGATPAAIIKSVVEPLRPLVPRPFVAFGYLEGDRIVYPNPEGEPLELAIDPAIRQAMSEGQVVRREFEDTPETPGGGFLLRAGVRRCVLTACASGGEANAVLVVGTRDARFAFSARHLALLRIVATILGPAMANARAAERAREDAEEQRFVARVAATAARAQTSAELIAALRVDFSAIVPDVALTFGWPVGEKGESYEFVRQGQFYSVPSGNYMRRAFEGERVAIEGAPEDLVPEMRTLLLHAGVSRSLLIPLSQPRGEILVMFLGTRDAAFRFSPRIIRLAELTANIVAPALTNALAYERTVREADEQRLIAAVASALPRLADPTRLGEEVLEPLARIVPRPVIYVGELHRGHTTWRVGDEFRHVPLTARMQTVLEEGAFSGTTADADNDYGRSARAAGQWQYVMLRLDSGGEPLGILYIASQDPDFQFTPRDMALFRIVAGILGPAIAAARSAQQVEAERSLYNIALGSLSESVILLDAGGRVVFRNDAGQALIDLIEQGEDITIPDEIAARLPGPVAEDFIFAFAAREHRRGRSALQTPDGARWYDYELVPLTHPLYRLLVVATDVTAEVARAEEAGRHQEELLRAARLAALGGLIGGVAHELNNPLTAILGFTELMAESPGPFAEEIDVIRKEALRARNVVRDLLFIARPGPVEHGEVSLMSVASHIERLRRATWAQHGIDGCIEGPPGDAPVLVSGNEHQLAQVLLNLVTNAEQALAGRPGARITVRVRVEDAVAVLEVEDNGPGMDEAVCQRVFEPFFTTKQGTGTGLGLSTSHTIVTAHGGTIGVESAPGAGTRFFVRLPLYTPAAEAAPARPPHAEAAAAGLDVLLVDDEPALRAVGGRLLGALGHRCWPAGTVDEAVALARSQPFDVVICDYRLGTATAADVVRAFQQEAPALVPRVIIATGATTDRGVADLSREFGFPILAKPYGIPDVKGALRPFLERHRDGCAGELQVS